jgi:hypothetical protein
MAEKKLFFVSMMEKLKASFVHRLDREAAFDTLAQERFRPMGRGCNDKGWWCRPAGLERLGKLGWEVLSCFSLGSSMYRVAETLAGCLVARADL